MRVKATTSCWLVFCTLSRAHRPFSAVARAAWVCRSCCPVCPSSKTFPTRHQTCSHVWPSLTTTRLLVFVIFLPSSGLYPPRWLDMWPTRAGALVCTLHPLQWRTVLTSVLRVASPLGFWYDSQAITVHLLSTSPMGMGLSSAFMPFLPRFALPCCPCPAALALLPLPLPDRVVISTPALLLIVFRLPEPWW